LSPFSDHGHKPSICREINDLLKKAKESKALTEKQISAKATRGIPWVRSQIEPIVQNLIDDPSKPEIKTKEDLQELHFRESDGDLFLSWKPIVWEKLIKDLQQAQSSEAKTVEGIYGVANSRLSQMPAKNQIRTLIKEISNILIESNYYPEITRIEDLQENTLDGRGSIVSGWKTIVCEPVVKIVNNPELKDAVLNDLRHSDSAQSLN
jgi:hypothetical protein